MKKAMYEQPTLKTLCFEVEDVIRTSNTPTTTSGDALFEGYTAEEWN